MSYTSVIGSGVKGGLDDAPSLVALLSYAALAGEGKVSGDGESRLANVT